MQWRGTFHATLSRRVILDANLNGSLYLRVFSDPRAREGHVVCVAGGGVRKERGFTVAKAPMKKASAAKSARPPRPIKGRSKTTLLAKSKQSAIRPVAQRTKPAAAADRSPGPVARRANARDLERAAGNNGGAIPAPVPSNDKPRKNQAGFNTRELEHFRDLLLAKRREIVGDMSSMEREALRSSGGSNLSTLPIHMADMGTDNYEQEFTLGLVETERKLLREINLALAKIQNGTYGICEGTGKAITKARLEVQPWARFSIEYAKQMEGRGTR